MLSFALSAILQARRLFFGSRTSCTTLESHVCSQRANVYGASCSVCRAFAARRVACRAPHAYTRPPSEPLSATTFRLIGNNSTNCYVRKDDLPSIYSRRIRIASVRFCVGLNIALFICTIAPASKGSATITDLVIGSTFIGIA